MPTLKPEIKISASSKKQLEKEIKKAAEKELKNQKLDVTCPSCGHAFNSKPGKAKCPKCGETINITLDVKWK